MTTQLNNLCLKQNKKPLCLISVFVVEFNLRFALTVTLHHVMMVLHF